MSSSYEAKWYNRHTSLHIIDASGKLTRSLHTKIGVAYDKACEVSQKLLGLNDAFDIVVVPDANMVIPETGISGYTPNKSLVYIYINPDFHVTEEEMFSTICHEIAHVKRYQKDGYGTTLLDSIIFEGLAMAFEEETSKHGSFVTKHLLARKTTSELISNTKASYKDVDFDYNKWFIYDKSGALPRWAGYEIGYYLVREHIRQSGKKASELMLEKSNTFWQNKSA